ncbi:MAG TPA: hypothetical protein VLC91_15920 [Spongiibacteraceae bacterium]|nr:hypothetical protein [Spongiibacteraceae bacterium]
MIRFRFKKQAPLLAGIFGLTLGLGLSSTASAAGSFQFTDSFDKLYKGQKLNSASNAKLGASNVVWTDEANTTLVNLTDSTTLAKPGFSGVKPITNPAIPANSARTGDCTTCALQFYYPSGINSWAEQRYSINSSALGTKGLTEIWLQYDIYIPSNYFHRDLDPASTSWVGGGEKLIAMYADEYSGSNPTLILGLNMMRRDYYTSAPNTTNVGGSLQSGSFSVMRNGARDWYQMWPEADKPVVNIKVDLGTWQRRTIHVVMPTSATSNDGVVEFWVKRANGTVGKIIDAHDGWFFGGTQNYINGGYLLGWSNTGFDSDTYFLIDNVIVASNSSMVDGTALGQAPQKSPPAQVQGLQGIQINTTK